MESGLGFHRWDARDYWLKWLVHQGHFCESLKSVQTVDTTSIKHKPFFKEQMPMFFWVVALFGSVWSFINCPQHGVESVFTVQVTKSLSSGMAQIFCAYEEFLV